MTKLYKVTYVLPCTSDITDVSLGRGGVCVCVCVCVCVFAFVLVFIKGGVAPRPRKKSGLLTQKLLAASNGELYTAM